MPDISGPTSLRQFAFFDPDTSSWRTCGGTFPWGSMRYSDRWPKRGSMRSGACYAHPTWVPATSEHDSSSLLGTPTAHPRTHTPRPVQHGMQLANQIALLPTPVVNDMGAGKTPERWDEWTAEMQEKHGNGNGHGKSLSIEVGRLLPTPTASMTTGAGTQGREGGMNLQTAVVSELNE